MKRVEALAIAPDVMIGALTEIERKNAPRELYVSGDHDLLTVGPRIAVVGSRDAADEDLARARALTRVLVQKNIVVVSGLARGIDAQAHRTAIESGGRTVAVLGSPLDQFYPSEHADLQREIAETQLCVSQFRSGSRVTPKNFPIRNRTMALLSDATIIVTAGEKSGTLHQGWEALRLGRLLFILENVARSESLVWPAEMIRYGAQVLTRENLEDVLTAIPAVTSPSDEALAA